MNFGIPGWEAELQFDEIDGDKENVTVRLVARRTSEGPWTEEDQWMFEHGNGYLQETLKRVHGNFMRDIERHHDEPLQG